MIALEATGDHINPQSEYPKKGFIIPQKPKAKSNEAKAAVLHSLAVVTKVGKGYHEGRVLVTWRRSRFKDGVPVGVEIEERDSIDLS